MVKPSSQKKLKVKRNLVSTPRVTPKRKRKKKEKPTSDKEIKEAMHTPLTGSERMKMVHLHSESKTKSWKHREINQQKMNIKLSNLDPIDFALKSLEESFIPEEILCREDEKYQIQKFIIEGISSKGRPQALCKNDIDQFSNNFYFFPFLNLGILLTNF